MANKLTWDELENRLYETGVDKVALYLQESGAYPKGVAWNGITGVTESPSGAEASPIYADGIKYLNLMSTETLGLTVAAYTYPKEFGECDGSASVGTIPGIYAGQQKRKVFGLAYESIIGNAEDGVDHGKALHLVYGCQASPAERAYATVNDSPEAINFSWSVSTTPVEVPELKPTSLITIKSTEVTPEQWKALEEACYGNDGEGTPHLPLPAEVISIAKGAHN